MKSISKRNLIILVNFVIIFSFWILSNNKIDLSNDYFNNRLENTNKFYLDDESLHLSKISGHIHIDDNDPVCNWSVAMEAGICTGNGTYFEPYVIEDFVINGGSVGSCIWIENSNVYFRIENCSLTNSAKLLTQAGIKLNNVNNSYLINNNCSFNDNGIRADNCYNNTITGNTAYTNTAINTIGIYLLHSDYNIITGNTLIGNGECILEDTCYSNFFENNNCIYNIQEESEKLVSYIIMILIVISFVAIIIGINMKMIPRNS